MSQRSQVPMRSLLSLSLASGPATEEEQAAIALLLTLPCMQSRRSRLQMACSLQQAAL